MAARNRGKEQGNKKVNNQGHKQGNTRGKDGGNAEGKLGGNKKINPEEFVCARCNQQWKELEPFNAHLHIRYKTGQSPLHGQNRIYFTRFYGKNSVVRILFPWINAASCSWYR
ncbi:hypothetical protein SLA2020_323210 [Shorea laevis]